MSSTIDRGHADQLQRLNSLPTDKRAAMEKLLGERGIDLSIDSGATLRQAPLAPRARDGELPLSFDQQRLWFLQQMEPSATAFNLQMNLAVTAPIEILQRAFNDLIARHEILRTTYRRGAREPVQMVHPPQWTRLDVEDVTQLTDEKVIERLVPLMNTQRERPFDLTTGVWRAQALSLSSGRCVLFMTVHHIATDGWSINQLAGELRHLCDAHVEGREPRLPVLPVQYADFAIWQRESLTGPALDKKLAYWRKRLDGMPHALELRTDLPRPAIQTRNGSALTVELPAALCEGLRALGQRCQATFFMTLLALYKVLLARNTGQFDVVVGTPIAGRSLPELQHVHGLFLNSLVLRTELTEDSAFEEVLARVRETVLGAFSHEDVPFEKVVEALHPRRDLSRNPLFQAFFTKPIIDQLARESGRSAAVAATVHRAQGQSEFDLSLFVEEYEKNVELTFHFNADLFHTATIERFASQYLRLAEAAVADSRVRVLAMELMSAREREQVLVEWNATRREVPGEPVTRLFERQAHDRPEAIALEFEGRELTYGELNARANRLARRLRAAGVGTETKVGVYLERGVEMVVGVLAVMKSGGAYVPLDPAYPRDRIAFMLEDSCAAVLLSQSSLLSRSSFGDACACVVSVDGDAQDIAQYDAGNLESAPCGGDLAQVIYTSGSTGRPKGVLLEHASLTNVLQSVAARLGFRADDVGVSVATLSFDIAGAELYLPLISGARVVVASRATAADGRVLAALLKSRAVTFMLATPATWRLLLAARWPGSDSLRIISTGEALPRELAEQLLPRCRELWDLYGPTETAIWSTEHRVASAPGPVPIGRPIANTQLYILDSRGQPQPVGVAGELHIGGAGVARGYWRRDDLSAERFIDNPFGSGRLYRTGDLARYRCDGVVEYLGRRDTQVKLRGFRIELGEIESVLERSPGVEAAVATIREDRPGEQRLVAYVKASSNAQVTADALRAVAARELPGYMVPAAWVFLDALPLTPNGKVDRKALPLPEASAPETAIVEARTDVERRVAAIWRDVLGVARVGIQDNFFDLGGQSLLIGVLQGRLADEFRVELPLVELFEHCTVESQARRVARDAPGEISVEDSAQQRGSRMGVSRRARRLRKDAPDSKLEEVAVIGFSGRFAGADSIEELWTMLCEGREGISFFDAAQLVAAGVDAALASHPEFVKAKGMAKDVDLFDAAFFGYSPADAEALDPQHRVFLQCAWSGLENAGYDASTFEGAIGLYAAASLNSYSLHDALARGHVDGLLLNDKDFLATRVSYKLNLRGPSMTVQTACSSSLVAVAEACESLLDHRSDLALAGGVSVSVPLASGHFYTEGSIGSRDGHCRAFDAGASGCVSGNGAGVVVLKRLSEALADGDTILGVIKAAAVNNDGAAKVGYTAPSVAGQAEVISTALSLAGVDADSIGYVEAHGTGTILGDPIEIAALTKAYRASTTRLQYCAVGSIKTNIGHLDAAAGVAGLIKAILCLHHRQLPPSLNFREPNPKIDFANSPFFVNTELRKWESAGSAPLRAGVSAFGLGGTNVHLIVEEAPRHVGVETRAQPQLLVLSAKTPGALDSASIRLAAHLESHPDLSLADVAFTLQAGRRAFDHRRFAVCESIADAVRVLRELPTTGPSAASAVVAGAGAVFMFSGQGTQYPNMTKGLYLSNESFRAEIDQSARLLEPHLRIDLRTLLYPQTGQEEAAAQSLRETQYAQPALFVVEYAMARLWMRWGIQPQAMIGHSIGEYVAACLADVMALEDALAVVAMRGRLMQAQSPGAMLSVPLGAEAVTPWLRGSLCVAAANTPSSCVVSGSIEDVKALELSLASAGHEGRLLQTSHAFHSAMMDPVVDPLIAAMRRLRLKAPRIPYVSNVSGGWITAAEATDAAYWGRHVRACVQFSAGLDVLLPQKSMFLELGPGNALCTFVAQHGAAAEAPIALPMIRHPRQQRDDLEFLLAGLGRAWSAGARCDWLQVHAGESPRRIPLPAYPFEGRRYWHDIDSDPRHAARPGPQARRTDVADWFHVPLWRQTAPVARRNATQGSSWLVCADEEGVGEELAKRLTAEGGQVTLVRPGIRFERGQDGAFTLDPGADSQYDALFEALASEQRLPSRIVHMWAITGDAANGTHGARDRMIERCFWSPTCLVRSVGRIAAGSPVELTFVSNGVHDVLGGEEIFPEKATLLGPCRVAPQEYPDLVCRNIDLILPRAAASSRKSLAEQLAVELSNEFMPGPVALRGLHRWVEVQEPMRIEAPQGTARLRDRGVYMITGGLGGMGLAIAEELARSTSARLVMVSRTALPERAAWDAWLASHPRDHRISDAMRSIRSLEALGAEVLVAAADVADLAQMRAVVSQARTKWGAIHGVVHAAGIPAGGIIELKKRSAADAVLAPKVRGTRVLEEVLSGQPLDFVVLCSSITATIPTLGQVDYTAANAYLDAFAQARSVREGGLTVSIQWDVWGETGMAVHTEIPAELAESRQRELASGIRTREGVDVFRRALVSSMPRLVISTTDLETRIASKGASATVVQAPAPVLAATKLHQRPSLPTAFVLPRTDTERRVATVWEEVFKVGGLGVHDNFFELGGHSLLAIQAAARLRADFGIAFSLDRFLELGTIERVASHVDAACWTNRHGAEETKSQDHEARDEFEV